MDVGALTIDSTTEEVKENDPNLRLDEKIVSEGGRCGMVTLFLGLLKYVVLKYNIHPTQINKDNVGRGTEFYESCDQVWRVYNGEDNDNTHILVLRLEGIPEHAEYDPLYGEMEIRR